MPHIEFTADARSFQQGFMFAQTLLTAMGHKVDGEKLFEYLYEVWEGKVSLTPSPLDAIREFEVETGKPATDSIRATMHKLIGDDKREEINDYNKNAAETILLMFKDACDAIDRKMKESRGGQ